MLVGKEIYDNVDYVCRNFIKGGREYAFEELHEYPYLTTFLRRLQEILAERFNTYRFLIYSKVNQFSRAGDEDIIPPYYDPHLIVFYISDETGSIPEPLMARCKAVFKVHLQHETEGNLFYFPLGYANGDECDIQTVNNRAINVFFSGALNRSRVGLYKALSGLDYIPEKLLLLTKRWLPADLSGSFPNSNILFTSGFASGLTQSDYNNLLYSCKIALAPHGFVNPETFRHYEAMRAGCIVVSLEMPPIRMYKNAPIIQLESWGQLDARVTWLLKDKERLEALQTETLMYWKDNCTEESTARYVANTLAQLG
ncbi:MAG TPA: hypothetical protein ENI62_14235 [Gammaproteobacteria bacterium]|nr:hypothetical protein [Gammaproteobacteria bacterium]